MDAFAVVLANPIFGPEGVPPVAEALAEALELVPYDATSRARKVRGVLAESLPYERAARLVSALRSRDVPSALAPAAAEPSLRPRPVREVAVRPEGLEVQAGYGAMTRIEWERIRLVGLCRYLEPKRTVRVRKPSGGGMFGMGAAFMTGGLGAGLRAARKASRAAAKRVVKVRRLPGDGVSYVADIHTAEPDAIYRLRSRNCAYRYLAEHLREHAEENFQLVVANLADTGGALLSPHAERFLRGDDLADETVEDLRDFEQYNRWLFLAAVAFSEEEAAEPDAPAADTPRMRTRGFDSRET